MSHRRALFCLAGSILFTFAANAHADSRPADTRPSTLPATSPATLPALDLKDYKTVANAAPGKVKVTASSTPSQPGYLGVSISVRDGKAFIDQVAPQSPAADAGLAIDDQIVKISGVAMGSSQAVRETLLALSPGETVHVAIRRAGKDRELVALLAPVSRPMRISGVRAVMGITLKDSPDSDGPSIDRLTPDMPAAKAGLLVGDILLKIDDAAVGAMATLNELLASYAPDDFITVHYRRDGKQADVRLKLVGDPRATTDVRTFSSSAVFKKDVYRLAVICVEYPDAKHTAQITEKDWESSFFSTGAYKEKNATGQPVFGSLNDYYQEVSCGKLKVEGKAFPWVQVSKNRADYGAGSGDTRLLNEALDKVLERDGKEALKGYDGLLFLYAGGRIQTNRGNIYWPHKGLMIHQGRRWTFFICPEGGNRMNNISVFVHEFGHMLGLPDLYARPENPGSEGLGQWCLMSNQLGNGRPQHMSAWCKEQLGWVTPTVIDPAVKQKLILSPIEGSTKECFKVLARADGSEYFLLEARKKTGFDTELPGEGLLIWRVVRSRPILEESHGVEGPLGPRSFLRAVPFPSASNRAFTPYTTPDSRPQLGGGLPVFITDIQRLSDGRMAFSIGYEVY